MKTKCLLPFSLSPLLICLLAAALPARAAEDLSATLQRGLFEEEANNNLAAAIKAYESVVTATDAQRKLAGTALFRLAECYRKLGRTNDAATHYQRVLNEYPDQPRLTDLSRQYLIAAAPAVLGTELQSERARMMERELVQAQAEQSRLSTVFSQLTNRARAELKALLPSVSPDQMLSTLQEQLAKAEQRRAELRHSHSDNHPDVKSAIAVLETLGRQIDERIDGIIAGIKLKVDAAAAQVARLKEQLEEAHPAREAVASALSPSARAEQKRLFEEEIKLVEKELKALRDHLAAGTINEFGLMPKQRELLGLRRQLAALGDAPSASASPSTAAPTDDEDKEVRRIQALIKDSPDLINATDVGGDANNAGGSTRLHVASRKGQLVVARFLLANRADVNMAGGNSMAPLHEAAKAGHRSMTELLLTNGASIDARGSARKTPLHLAVENGFKSVVEVLLAAKADPNLADGNGDTPLHVAARNNRALCEMLAGAGAQVDARNKKGRTPLSIAAGSSSEVTEFLLSKGADPNTKDENQFTPLHHAAQFSQAKSIAVLLSQKADPNLANATGNTPLHIAAQVNQPPVVQALLAGGASPNARNNKWEMPLWHAVSAGSAEVTGAMLKAGGNPNLPNGEDAGSSWNVLQYACSKGDKELVRLLLEAGGDPNTRVETGYKNHKHGQWTPLLMAVADNSADVSHLLLDAKADPNHRASDGGYTALLFAVSNRSTNLVVDLLEHGADIEARDGGGSTPLTRAIAVNDLDVIELLLRHKASPNTKSPGGSTPLHFAAVYFKAKEVFDLLLSHGADPNVTDGEGRTPLEVLKGGGGPASPRAGRSLSFPALPAPPPADPATAYLNSQLVRTSPSVRRDPPKAAGSSELADLLRKGGALDEVPLMDRIMVQRAAAQKREVVFTQSQSNWNQFTLLELIGVEYGFLATQVASGANRVWSAPYSAGTQNQFGRRDLLPFPDLAQVKIRRLAPDRKSWKEIKVDVAALLKSGDRARDVPLEWGDAVEIPELDHSIAENWKGFDKETLFALRQMLAREVSITVKGDTLRTNLAPDIMTVKEYNSLAPGGSLIPAPVSFRPDGTLETPDRSRAPAVLSNRRFTLHSLLYDSGLLRSSSDASRVRVKRRAAATGPAREWTLNAADPNARPDLWLRDGDVIEVPERE